MAEARTAQQRLIDAEREAAVARAEFHRAVRRLHLYGASLRELAASLGLSHQRVHQIVQAVGGSRRWVRVRKPGRNLDPSLLACTFCGQTEDVAHQLMAGPHIFICPSCIALAGEVVRSGQAAATGLGTLTAVPAGAARPGCSFCGKNRDQVPGLAVLPSVTVRQTSAPAAICSECVTLSAEILAAEAGHS